MWTTFRWPSLSTETPKHDVFHPSCSLAGWKVGLHLLSRRAEYSRLLFITLLVQV